MYVCVCVRVWCNRGRRGARATLMTSYLPGLHIYTSYAWPTDVCMEFRVGGWRSGVPVQMRSAAALVSRRRRRRRLGSRFVCTKLCRPTSAIAIIIAHQLSHASCFPSTIIRTFVFFFVCMCVYASVCVCTTCYIHRPVT